MAERFLRIAEVMARTGLSRSTIYLRIARGRFPRPVPLGSPNVVGFVESEIETWISDTVQAARSPDGATAA